MHTYLYDTNLPFFKKKSNFQQKLKSGVDVMIYWSGKFFPVLGGPKCGQFFESRNETFKLAIWLVHVKIHPLNFLDPQKAASDSRATSNRALWLVPARRKKCFHNIISLYNNNHLKSWLF